MRSKQNISNESNKDIAKLTNEMATGGSVSFLGNIVGRILRFAIQVILRKYVQSHLYSKRACRILLCFPPQSLFRGQYITQYSIRALELCNLT